MRGDFLNQEERSIVMGKKPSRKEMDAVVKELAGILKPKPPLKDDVKDAQRMKQIKKLASLLAGDTISKETSDFLTEQGIEFKAVVKPKKKTPAKKTPAKKTPAKKTPAKKDEKKTPAKKTPAKKDEKKTPAKKKAATPKKAKKPGVIATIFELVKTKGPITEDNIVKALVKKFPDRQEQSMRNTVKVQLPNRMSRERNVKIEKTDKGFVMK